ncbi:MAG: disulfide bond formation protein B [Litorimonas sp.]
MMSKFLTRQYAPWIALCLSSGLLIGAWVFQYGFGYAPCTMCYWQRHAHKLIIGLALLTLILRKTKNSKFETPLIWLLVIALLGSASLAFYHAGVEYKWWEGPKTCSSGGVGYALPEIDPNDPLAALNKPIKGPSCSDAVWHFIGLSMAAWNAILSTMGAALIALARKPNI